MPEVTVVSAGAKRRSRLGRAPLRDGECRGNPSESLIRLVEQPPYPDVVDVQPAFDVAVEEHSVCLPRNPPAIVSATLRSPPAADVRQLLAQCWHAPR
ncbi:hypothetical protein [Frankia sp. CiP3]|uniref:hypothetical protein n=1 Tax=Frankia sp. CiP3 TaxID=2880971 RepID=UPI001EF3E04C|nr:hypothetical protein [Frankia sp. CiP3]